MQVELRLVGTSNLWLLSGPRIVLGRDPICEVVLPPERYPMVSREHAILTLENGRMRLADSQSTNGTFVNGSKISSAMLTKLDRFRLGQDGPEFEVRIVEEEAAMAAPTTLSAQPQTVAADPASAPTRIAKFEKPQKPPTRAIARDPGESKADRTASVMIQSGPSAEDEEMIEQKLNSLRNLVYLLVAMVAVLLGVIFYQSQQIDKNRAELGDMRRQAQGAVAQFTPALDQRLDAFNQRLDQMDTKMKDAEDQFMSRLNDELPRMLDKYVDRKVKQLSAAAPQLPTEQK
jgi:pSer/pThr/pTyr-binding forkhead associated (FHA) protein